MLKHIFKMLWVQRKTNWWIFIELLVVSIAMWWVVEPVFVIAYKYFLPNGYDYENVYKIVLGEYAPTSEHYQIAEPEPLCKKDNFRRLRERIRVLPEVIGVTVVGDKSYPCTGNYNGSSCFYDTLSLQVRRLFYQGGDYFKVFRFTQVSDHDWKSLDSIPVDSRSVFITADVKQKLFGDKPALGKEISFEPIGPAFKIAGILDCVKMSFAGLPEPLCILPSVAIPDDWYMPDIFIRVKDGVNEDDFIRKIKKEIGGKLQIGNYYFKQIVPGHKLQEDYSYFTGVTNQIRMQSGLAVFFLLNMMLGVLGTFWLRCNARREEIGLRMAMGSTRNQIRWLFIGEGWLLTSIASVLGYIIVFQFVYANGLPNVGSPSMFGDYLIHNTLLCYACVCGITYLLLMLTVAVGIWFPASTASKVEPVNALRDE